MPVLSKTMVSAWATASMNRPPLTEIWCPLHSRMAESTAMGMASFRAQEKSTISTDRVLVTFRVSRYVSAVPPRV